ncbi:MAG: hypothetical protein KDD36_14100, partial [Flavobacteriales bacterium]|nr:hypothetical protein [Flavobacteriales bacterium]
MEKDKNTYSEVAPGISPKGYTWRTFRRNRPAYYSLYILGVLALVALLAPLLATDMPWYIQYRSQNL